MKNIKLIFILNFFILGVNGLCPDFFSDSSTYIKVLGFSEFNFIVDIDPKYRKELIQENLEISLTVTLEDPLRNLLFEESGSDNISILNYRIKEFTQECDEQVFNNLDYSDKYICNITSKDNLLSIKDFILRIVFYGSKEHQYYHMKIIQITFNQCNDKKRSDFKFGIEKDQIKFRIEFKDIQDDFINYPGIITPVVISILIFGILIILVILNTKGILKIPRNSIY